MQGPHHRQFICHQNYLKRNAEEEEKWQYDRNVFRRYPEGDRHHEEAVASERSKAVRSP